MASKTTASSPFFFIFDFYLMKGSKDDNDVVPEAILYFYPTEEQKKLKLLDCSEIVGVVQYFRYALLQSIPKALYFEKSFLLHEHHGRHSAFLSLPSNEYSFEEGHIYLKHILDLFHLLYGTWNHIYATYTNVNKMSEFLHRAMTPIVRYVLTQNRSISHLFSTIEYTPLMNGTQRALLESKHYLDYLKSKYNLRDGLIGYDSKVLYSTWGADTTYYMQLFFQLIKTLPKDLIYIPWESEFKLKSGVSLYRIYISRTATAASAPQTVPVLNRLLTSTSFSSKTTTRPIKIFDSSSPTSDDSLSIRSRFNSIISPAVSEPNRFSLVLTDQSASSEETGFETDTFDAASTASTSSKSLDESSIVVVEHPSSASTWHDESLTDEQKLELRSRSSTLSDEMEQTMKEERKNSSNSSDSRIRITQIAAYESDEEDRGDFSVVFRKTSDPSRDRSSTITSNPDMNLPELLKSDRQEVRVSWTNIPDINIEQDRDQLVLYTQKNSRMIFAGIIEQNLLDDTYLKNLWNSTLTQMANMETDIQVSSTLNEVLKTSADARFQYNENTRLVQYGQLSDGNRQYRRIPSEESAYLALLARSEINRNTERRVIGLSRGSQLISVDRRLPDRTIYSCRRFQENL